MKNTFNIILLLVFVFTITITQAQVKQINLNRVDEMADLPQPLQIIDWKLMSKQFDKTIYDFNAKGEYWPMVWMENNNNNFKERRNYTWIHSPF